MLNQQTVYAQLRKLEDEWEKTVRVTHHKRRKPNTGTTRREAAGYKLREVGRSIGVLSAKDMRRFKIQLKVLDLLADKLVYEEWDDLSQASKIIREACKNIDYLVNGDHRA